DRHFSRQNIIGSSPAMTKLFEVVEQVSPSEATVLIHGESGTGKELIAGMVHYNSFRETHPFIKINCAAITETLLESELFGHEKGAFTGADKKKEGKFLQADKGSLLLDEVSEMPLSMQVKLLRVLQEREITRVGGNTVVPVDVRVIAATNKNLTEMVNKGKFREDLFYRLNVVLLEVPALRNRGDDIPLLAVHFLTLFSEKNRKKIKGFTPAAMDCLIKYHWPGNVRELMNTVERTVVLARSDYIDVADLPMVQRQPLPENAFDIRNSEQESVRIEGVSLETIEKTAIIKMLQAVNRNKSEAARRLGITRKTLHKKLKQYGLMP
ncbi:MAG: sigma-54-dependent Fis family transcriptional regulator, partial [Deltaproteobacteria bacterium]